MWVLPLVHKEVWIWVLVPSSMVFQPETSFFALPSTPGHRNQSLTASPGRKRSRRKRWRQRGMKRGNRRSECKDYFLQKEHRDHDYSHKKNSINSLYLYILLLLMLLQGWGRKFGGVSSTEVQSLTHSAFYYKFLQHSKCHFWLWADELRSIINTSLIWHISHFPAYASTVEQISLWKLSHSPRYHPALFLRTQLIMQTEKQLFVLPTRSTASLRWLKMRNETSLLWETVHTCMTALIHRHCNVKAATDTLSFTDGIQMCTYWALTQIWPNINTTINQNRVPVLCPIF